MAAVQTDWQMEKLRLWRANLHLVEPYRQIATSLDTSSRHPERHQLAPSAGRAKRGIIKPNMVQSRKNTKYPEIRIVDAMLLRNAASTHLHELWAKPGDKLADHEEMRKVVAKYQKAWQPYQTKILTGMCQTTGLQFEQNIIDVYIAPWFRAFSDPLVIGVNLPPDLFIDTLTHELLHRLLITNTSLPFDTDYIKIWQKLFGKNHTHRTLVHIPVHAIHQAIYLDVLNEPARLKRDIANNKQHGAVDYEAAWDYVEEHGYKNIIAQLKRSYR